MSLKEIAVEFVTTFAITFVVALVVIYLWGLIGYGSGHLAWEASLRLALILAIIFPAFEALTRRRKS